MRLIDADALKKLVKAFRNDAPQSSVRKYVCDVILSMLGDENQTPTIEAEPVVHAKWVDRYGGKYANRLYECSACKGKALYKVILDELGKECIVQVLSAACPHCRAKMDGDSHAD